VAEVLLDAPTTPTAFLLLKESDSDDD